MNEKAVQAALMSWALNEKNHDLVVPNSTSFFSWESDLISVTRAGLIHEYEVKISKADYNRDAGKKRTKRLVTRPHLGPSYFWYATYGFEIEPPEHAGWLSVEPFGRIWRVAVRKAAPRLNNRHVTEKEKLKIAHLLSWRVANFYDRFLRFE